MCDEFHDLNGGGGGGGGGGCRRKNKQTHSDVGKKVNVKGSDLGRFILTCASFAFALGEDQKA